MHFRDWFCLAPPLQDRAQMSNLVIAQPILATQGVATVTWRGTGGLNGSFLLEGMEEHPVLLFVQQMVRDDIGLPRLISNSCSPLK